MTRGWVLAAVVARGVTGCGTPIVVATIGDASDAPIACTVSDAGTTCPSGTFCETLSCDSTNGLCTPIVDKLSDPARYAPECGCDGISYFNRSRRQAAAMSPSSLTTSCESQTSGPHAACGIFAMAGCPDGTTCAAVFSDPSGPFAPYVADAGAILEAFCNDTPPTFHNLGNCWALPETCPPSSSASLLSCSGGCIDACPAIRAGGPSINCNPAPGDASAD
jgi:hypothetical protein